MKRMMIWIWVCTFTAGMAMSAAAKDPKADPRPTAEGVTAAEERLVKALQENDVDGMLAYLSDGWAVVTGFGDVVEGSYIFPEGIRTGTRTLTRFDTSELRVRVFGSSAVMTFKLHLAGVTGGKAFDVMERESDAWAWEDGKWKCVLSHETLIPKDEGQEAK